MISRVTFNAALEIDRAAPSSTPTSLDVYGCVHSLFARPVLGGTGLHRGAGQYRLNPALFKGVDFCCSPAIAERVADLLAALTPPPISRLMLLPLFRALKEKRTAETGRRPFGDARAFP